MPPAARVTDNTAHGGMIVAGDFSVLIGGMPAARLGDPHLCPFSDGPKPHIGGVIIMGSATVRIGNAPAARMGDLCGCTNAGMMGKGVPPVIGPTPPGLPPKTLAEGKLNLPAPDPALDKDPLGRFNNPTPPIPLEPSAKAEAQDVDQDGTYDTVKGDASVFSKEGQVAGPGGTGAKGKMDVAYAKGEAGASASDYGAGARASGEAGYIKLGGDTYVGPKEDGGANPYVGVGVEADVLHAEAKADGFIGDDGKRVGIGAQAKAGAEAVAGKAKAVTTIPIGWLPGVPDDFNIQIKGEGQGSLGSVGAGAGGWGFWDKQEERFHIGAFGELKALAGIELNVDISVGKAYPPPVSPGGGTQGVGAGGIPNTIIKGYPTVMIGP